MDSGLSIISKYPIEEYEFKAFSSGVYADKLASKGILYTKVRISEKDSLALFVTHAQAGYELADLKAEKVQREQMDEMMQFVNKKALNSQMVLFAGL